MASRWVLREYHSIASGLDSSSLAATEIAFRSQDTSGAYGNYTIAVPDTGGTFNYSYESVVALVCTVAPDISCSNFKVWMTKPEQSTAGMRFMHGSSDSAVAPTDVESSIATSDANEHMNAGDSDDWDRDAYTSAGDRINYLYMQLRSSSDAAAGDANVIYHWMMDEA